MPGAGLRSHRLVRTWPDRRDDVPYGRNAYGADLAACDAEEDEATGGAPGQLLWFAGQRQHERLGRHGHRASGCGIGRHEVDAVADAEQGDGGGVRDAYGHRHQLWVVGEQSRFHDARGRDGFAAAYRPRQRSPHGIGDQAVGGCPHCVRGGAEVARGQHCPGRQVTCRDEDRFCRRRGRLDHAQHRDDGQGRARGGEQPAVAQQGTPNPLDTQQWRADTGGGRRGTRTSHPLDARASRPLVGYVIHRPPRHGMAVDVRWPQADVVLVLELELDVSELVVVDVVELLVEVVLDEDPERLSVR